MIKALIFDFDGLILDTETPEYLAWQNIYSEHGFELPHEELGKIIGGSGHSKFDAAEHLTLLSQGRLDSVSLRARFHLECDSAIARAAVLPGVLDYIHEAKRLRLKLAIASSSPHSWVDNHAKRLGIFYYFDKVICSDDVGVGRVKPNPDLFLLALEQLQGRCRSRAPVGLPRAGRPPGDLRNDSGARTGRLSGLCRRGTRPGVGHVAVGQRDVTEPAVVKWARWL